MKNIDRLLGSKKCKHCGNFIDDNQDYCPPNEEEAKKVRENLDPNESFFQVCVEKNLFGCEIQSLNLLIEL